MASKFRVAVLLVSCSPAVGACGGSGKGASGSAPEAASPPPSTSTSTTSPTTTESSTTSQPEKSATAVSYAAPVDAQGRQLTGFSVSPGGSGMCEPGSDVIGNANVYRCFAGNSIYDPCWALTGGSGSGSAVLCQPDPWSKAAVKITLSSAVARTVAKSPNLDDPWAVQLTDGQHCLGLQGAHSEFEGRVINYSCPALGSSPGIALLAHPDRSAARWSFSSVEDHGSSQASGPTVYVAAAFFAGPAPAATAACAGSDLSVTAAASNGGLGHDAIVIRFRNTASASCTLHGYPGVASLDSSGHQAAQATRSPSGYLGGVRPGASVPTVTLGAGQTASALVESTDNPTGGATSCPTYRSFLVTPPNTTTSMKVSASLVDCSGMAVHPVVAGTTGSQNPS